MSQTKLVVVVNLRRESYDVYGGRPSVYGNPFKIGPDGTRAEVIAKYKEYFYHRVRVDRLFKLAVLKLLEYGDEHIVRIGCYCKPQPCHSDVIAEYLNKQSEG